MVVDATVAWLIALAMLVLMKIVCFILGYLTIRLGHDLIGRGVKGEFKFSGALGGAKADLVSVSPGLLFVLLGVILIGYAMYVTKSVDLTKSTSNRPPVPSVALPDSG